MVPSPKLVLTRIFHTGSSRGATNPFLDTTGGRETAVVLPEEQFEADVVSIKCSQAAAESV
jgi:hypothetical protein